MWGGRGRRLISNAPRARGRHSESVVLGQPGDYIIIPAHVKVIISHVYVRDSLSISTRDHTRSASIPRPRGNTVWNNCDGVRSRLAGWRLIRKRETDCRSSPQRKRRDGKDWIGIYRGWEFSRLWRDLRRDIYAWREMSRSHWKRTSDEDAVGKKLQDIVHL